MKYFTRTGVFLLVIYSFLTGIKTQAQQAYHVNKNAHSHNDYLQKQPFYQAHANHFYSMEIDVFIKDTNLFVAHTSAEIAEKRTIESLYIDPLLREFNLNGGKAYSDGGRLQFLVDIKNNGDSALLLLEKKLKPIRYYFDVLNNPNAVRLVISGSTPPPASFEKYDPIFFFDGRAGLKYTPDQWKRVAFVSAPFQKYSRWNGLGRMVKEDYERVKLLVDSIHQAGKEIRFWGNPDTKTTWLAFMKLGVDYINTDSPNEMARFLNTYLDNTYVAHEPHTIYTPTYKTDLAGKKPKNIILLISDGAGFSQLWAAATANRGSLNATRFRHIGFSNTAPADDYNTDSAGGATAMGTGEKTNNRYIGVDTLGRPIVNVVDKLATKGIKTGIISNDRVTGATPSSFYAHQQERNDSEKIANDLLKSSVTLLVGGAHPVFAVDSARLTKALQKQGFSFREGIGTTSFTGNRLICFDGDRPGDNFRLLENVFDKSVDYLKKQSKGKGFFVMMEGAKIDGGGHGNRIKQCIDEYLSFDRVIGKALQFADADGETLVLVTSDHETGGLIVYDGNYTTGHVTGTFTTNDHTGLPVPLLAYGPGAEKFTGFLQNNEIGQKVLALLNAK